VTKIFADTYYSQGVLAQALDISYNDALNFATALWTNDAQEVHLSLVGVDKKGLMIA
jgi:hypothetical protein